MTDYLAWMKGSRTKLESLHIYNFGYERNLPIPKMSAVERNRKLSLDTTMSKASLK